MTTDTEPPIPQFSFSDAAIAQIEAIRQEYLVHSPENPPVRLGILVGYPVEDNHEQAGPVAVCPVFWRRSEYPLPDRESIHSASGLNFVFAVTAEYRPLFEGKVVDYSAGRAFFLR